MKKYLKYVLWFSLVVLLSPFWLLAFFLVKNSLFPTWQAGSISDWFGVFFNMITAIVAIYAAIKARDFIENRTYNDAYDLSKDIIAYQFRDLFNSVVNFYSRFPHSPKKPHPHFVNIQEAALFDEETYIIIELINKIMREIESNLDVMEKLGFKLKPEYFEIYNTYTSTVNDITDVCYAISESFVVRMDCEDYSSETIDKKVESLPRLKKDLKDQYVTFYDLTPGFFDYFVKI